MIRHFQRAVFLTALFLTVTNSTVRADHAGIRVTDKQLDELNQIGKTAEQKADSIISDFDESGVFVSDRDRKYFLREMGELKKVLTGTGGISHWIEHVKTNVPEPGPSPVLSTKQSIEITILAGKYKRDIFTLVDNAFLDGVFSEELKLWSALYEKLLGKHMEDLTCQDHENVYEVPYTGYQFYTRYANCTLTAVHPSNLKVEVVEANDSIEGDFVSYTGVDQSLKNWREGCFTWIRKQAKLAGARFLGASCGKPTLETQDASMGSNYRHVSRSETIYTLPQ